GQRAAVSGERRGRGNDRLPGALLLIGPAVAAGSEQDPVGEQARVGAAPGQDAAELCSFQLDGRAGERGLVGSAGWPDEREREGPAVPAGPVAAPGGGE